MSQIEMSQIEIANLKLKCIELAYNNSTGIEKIVENARVIYDFICQPVLPQKSENKHYPSTH